MKNTFRSIVVIVLASIALTVSCSKSGQTDKNASPSVDRQTYKTSGVLRSVDKDGGRVTVDHEAIPGYMSAMEMNEAVSEPKMLFDLKPGDKVDLELERVGEKVTITKLVKTGETEIVNGGEIFKMNCATCHGDSGEGAPKGIPLTSGHALNHSETEHIEQVKNGEGNKMPAFRDKLSPDQIAAVVKFVRTEIQSGVTPEQRKQHHH